jgi:opacity protein-like surface antigen
MRRLLLLGVLALTTAIARADDPLFYVGAGISRNNLSGITNDGTGYADLDKTSWKATVGFRPISFFGVEADYIDLGSKTQTFIAEGTTTSSNAKAFAGYAVGYLPVPVPNFDLFGKVGLARWTLDGNGSSPNNSGEPVGPNFFAFSTRGTAFAWGAGAQFHWGNIGARLEYENFNITNTSGAGVLSLEAMLLFP